MRTIESKVYQKLTVIHKEQAPKAALIKVINWHKKETN